MWLRRVFRAWNLIVPALHAVGTDIYSPAVRALPWGALVARIEHLYLTDPLVRGWVDSAKE